jgi:Zn-finger nucleic acid-binding protein
MTSMHGKGEDPKISCPHDGQVMEKICLQGNLYVDRCAACGSMWFDAHEIERVVKLDGAVELVDRKVDTPGRQTWITARKIEEVDVTPGASSFSDEAARGLVHLEHAELGDDHVHAALAREGSEHCLTSLGVPLGGVLHGDDDALHARDEVHRAAHALDHLAGDHPVGEVALLGDLHRAQDAQVDVPAADHREARRRRRRTPRRGGR